MLRSALIGEIAFHGFLVELPAAAISEVLAGDTPELVLSDRIMFFRPKAQPITDGVNDAEVVTQVDEAGASEKLPIVALLDGLLPQNHQRLQRRLVVDDPDGWENGYEAKDRVHGTAMASLILHGELDGDSRPSDHRLYVRPVLRPDANDSFNKGPPGGGIVAPGAADALDLVALPRPPSPIALRREPRNSLACRKGPRSSWPSS